ncbi:hypothetical protein PV11_07392 [Exophiala sideris]|uniref:Uncharacterized protein n=1 Tax=Exophiala sideris TaxID=1016849 RepID=A0A0D1YA37_9EURO|nr:hypothetical protein PV11_07392 [Exophiala sideris]
MSEEPAAEIDMETAMREAMGFSSFAVRRPKNESDTQSQDTFAASSTSASGSNQVPLGEPRVFNQSTTEPALQHQPDQASFTPQPPTYAFTSPISNTYFTRTDLEELARGKVNANGDTVFFKPGFVSDDPWARLRDRNGKDMGRAK